MNEIKFIESIKILEVKENDTIIIKSKIKLSMNHVELIKKCVIENLSPNLRGKIKVLVLDQGLDIEVIRKGETET